MDTVSRGDWSRCSADLLQNPVFNGSPRHSRAARSISQASADDESSVDLVLQVERLWEKQHADEETPLVEDGSISTPHDDRLGRLSIKSSIVWSEATALVSLAVPVVLTYLLEMLPGILSIVLVGHVSPSPSSANTTKEYLDATALAVMYVNLTAISVGFGLASAMDTLCSQAYGAGELERKARVYLTTGSIVLAIYSCSGMFVLDWYAGQILRHALGQPEQVAKLAGTFVRYLMPGIPALFFYELLRKVLQAENVAMPMFYVAVVSNLINAGGGYYLVFGADHESSWLAYIGGPDAWLGAAVARTACNLSFPVLLIFYLVASGRWKALWSPPENQTDALSKKSTTATLLFREAIGGIPRFVALGIPGALQLCFEWWAFECLALLSGLLPDAIVAIGTNAILLNIASMVYMLYLGVSIAANVRIGNALGANQPVRARLAANLAFGFALTCAVMSATLLLVYRTQLPALFTHDAEIVDYGSRMLWIAACFQIPDSINAAVQGIFRGSGRQATGAWLNFAAYYVVGLPIGITLSFGYDMGLEGLWIGVSTGLLVVGIVGEFLVRRSDWSELSKDAVRRLTLVLPES